MIDPEVSITSHQPKPLGLLIKFTQHSILFCFQSTLEISKSLENSAQQMFMKVYKFLKFLREKNSEEGEEKSNLECRVSVPSPIPRGH